MIDLSDNLTGNNYIKYEAFLTPEESQAIAQRVLRLGAHWIPRGKGTFYTLGASTYNDDVNTYPVVASQENPILMRHFGGIIQRVCDFFQTIMAREVILVPHIGLPGFHIFDHSANGLDGHIHIDEPFKRINWPHPYNKPFTFTLPVELPAQAGLNVYPDIDEAWFREYDQGHDIAPPPAQYYPYETGTLYWHSGLLAHQIANPIDVERGTYRITLQGHGLTLGNQVIVLYF